MIKICSYKRVSIKFGILCGMIVTLSGAVNSVLGTVQKWNETFDKKIEISADFDKPSEGSWSIEQRIVGDVPTPSEPISEAPSSNRILSVSEWLVITLAGGGIMWFLILAHKKDTISIKNDKESDNII